MQAHTPNPAYDRQDSQDTQIAAKKLKRTDDRLRILEAQVDHLRGELEYLKSRHHEAIYSVAWHAAWPIRIIERFLRRLFKAKPVAHDLPQQTATSPESRIAAPYSAMTVEKLAISLQRRIDERF